MKLALPGRRRVLIVVNGNIVHNLFVAAADSGGLDRVFGAPAALCAAVGCFLIRVVGMRFGLDAPRPPGVGRDGSATSSSDDE